MQSEQRYSEDSTGKLIHLCFNLPNIGDREKDHGQRDGHLQIAPVSDEVNIGHEGDIAQRPNQPESDANQGVLMTRVDF